METVCISDAHYGFLPQAEFEFAELILSGFVQSSNRQCWQSLHQLFQRMLLTFALRPHPELPLLLTGSCPPALLGSTGSAGSLGSLGSIGSAGSLGCTGSAGSLGSTGSLDSRFHDWFCWFPRFHWFSRFHWFFRFHWFSKFHQFC